MQAAYNDTIVQAVTPLANKFRDITTHWKEQTQGFRNHAQAFATEAVRQHTELTVRIPTDLKIAGLKVLNDQHPSLIENIKDGLVKTAKTLVVGTAIVLGIWTIIPYLTVAGAGALVMLAAAGLAFETRLAALPWSDLSGGEKVGAVFAALGSSIPDTFGFTSLEEALTKTNSYTGEALNPREVQDRLVNGSTQSVTSIFAVKAMAEQPWVKAPGNGVPLPKGVGTEPVPEPNAAGTTETKPTESKPADTKPADAKTSTSVDTKPTDTKRGDAKSADTKSADPTPADKPADTKPADPKPTDTKPAVATPQNTSKSAEHSEPPSSRATRTDTDERVNSTESAPGVGTEKPISTKRGERNGAAGDHDDGNQVQGNEKTTQGNESKVQEAKRQQSVSAQPQSNLIWVKESDLQISDNIGPKEWEFSIHARLPNGIYREIAVGSAELDPGGNPVSGPEFAFDKRVTIGGKDFRIAIGDESTGQQLKLTKYALDKALSRFKSRFGHEPDTLSGGLIDDNKRNFQIEFAARIDKGIPETPAAIDAAKSISFGRARIERGYTEITVTLDGVERIEIGTPAKIRNVPKKIRITAKKP